MKRMVVILGTVALLAATGGASEAKADTYTTRGDFSFDRLASSPCLDEAVAFSGQAHFVTQITSHENGDMHVVGEVNYRDVRGEGTTSGTVYRIAAASHIVENYTGGGSTETDTSTAHVVSRGPGDNAIFRTFYHVTRNADGTVTIELSRIEGVCRG